jgi:hypothetical protein
MAVKKTASLAEMFGDIIRHAPGMRQAGVTRVQVGEVVVDLAPPPGADADAAPASPVPSPDDEFGNVRAFRGEEQPS